MIGGSRPVREYDMLWYQSKDRMMIPGTEKIYIRIEMYEGTDPEDI